MGADFFKFGGDLCLNLVVAVKWVDEDVVRPSVTIYDDGRSIEIDWRDVPRLAAWLHSICDGRDRV